MGQLKVSLPTTLEDKGLPCALEGEVETVLLAHGITILQTVDIQVLFTDYFCKLYTKGGEVMDTALARRKRELSIRCSSPLSRLNILDLTGYYL